MKWWQLLWLLNENLDYFQEVLAGPEWSCYREWLKNREGIRLTQRREILDAVVPDTLCLKALEGCPIRFVAEGDYLYGGFPATDTDKLTAVEAYLRCGGMLLVDAVDRGIAHLRNS